ncbi:MAG: hypothetical protein A2622_01745 [Bdellovibrionales bacterium RIFCSPHIGHO2_01_FULL_40_29]|nr:MAG: hypothetical protein A2622_01745 [Bdellovibrionales bacterium RIFCSPHIGHO2_01_FULL_40_29]OFZ33816.1 MAG: hypothetical protein A3D17_02165 [Bdellovibrionales bacterium RIFCSPHIGHO2_02_FULL_40_15]
MSNFRNNKGQILVEYLLLMVIAITCATILTKQLIGRGSDASNQGHIIRVWDRIIKTIGNDVPDCANQTDFNNANCPP